MLLSLDLATKTTGYAVFDGDGKLIDYGELKTSLKDKKLRMLKMKELIIEKIEEYSIDLIATEIEREYLGSLWEYKTARTLNTMQGVLLCTCDDLSIPLLPISIASWRSLYKINQKKGRDYCKEKAKAIARKQYKVEAVSDDTAEAILIGGFVIKNLNKLLTK